MILLEIKAIQIIIISERLEVNTYPVLLALIELEELRN